jgi:hypothetical protein
VCAERTNVNRGFVVSRKFAVDGGDPKSNFFEISEELNDLPGVLYISIKQGELFVTYDCSLIHIDQIFSRLKDFGVILRLTWWNQVKFSWAQNIDTNAHDSIHHIPHCCNKARPKIDLSGL